MSSETLLLMTESVSNGFNPLHAGLLGIALYRGHDMLPAFFFGLPWVITALFMGHVVTDGQETESVQRFAALAPYLNFGCLLGLLYTALVPRR